MDHGNTSAFQCVCCSPPRQIYIRFLGKGEFAYHEDDHSEAEVNRVPS